MDDYFALEMKMSQAQLCHIATGVMTGILNILPPDTKDKDNPISLKKSLKVRGVGRGQIFTCTWI